MHFTHKTSYHFIALFLPQTSNEDYSPQTSNLHQSIALKISEWNLIFNLDSNTDYCYHWEMHCYLPKQAVEIRLVIIIIIVTPFRVFHISVSQSLYKSSSVYTERANYN